MFWWLVSGYMLLLGLERGEVSFVLVVRMRMEIERFFKGKLWNWYEKIG